MSIQINIGPALRKVIPEGYEVRAIAEIVRAANIRGDISLELYPVYEPVEAVVYSERVSGEVG